MKLFLVLTVLFSFALSHSVYAEDSYAVKAMLTYCLPAVIKGEDASGLATNAKLPEFPTDKAINFSKDGRVFAIPQMPGNAVFIVRPNKVCSISVRKIDDLKLFWKTVDQWFGEETPFKLKDKKTSKGSTTRSYIADFNGGVVVHISARDSFKKSGVQAVLTASRFKD